MPIKVVNGKVNGFIGKDKIYIGRYNKSYNLSKSLLANPFSISSTTTRDRVIQQYKEFIVEELNNNAMLRNEFHQIVYRHMSGENLELTCWCAPLPCHGDYIKKLVEDYSDMLSKNK